MIIFKKGEWKRKISLDFTGIYWNLLETTGIYWNLQEITGICRKLKEKASHISRVTSRPQLGHACCMDASKSKGKSSGWIFDNDVVKPLLNTESVF